MGINIFDVQPHQVSRDLRGYSVFFYGEPKSGKTTTATKFPKHFLLAFEKGYNAIPGAMAQPINSWAEFKQVIKQLKDPRAKEMFETIIVDTADIAYDFCEKYICANAERPKEMGGGYGVDSIGDIPYGKGYTLAAREFDEALRSIVKMDYGLVLISHAVDKTFTDESGKEYNQIVPTLASKARNIVSRMADIIGYSRAVKDKDGNESTKLFIRGTTRYMAGSRFKYTPDYIDFNYQNLVNAIGDAIDKQMKEDGSEYFTDTRNNLFIEEELNFDELREEFDTLVNNFIKTHTAEEMKTNWTPKITQIIERYLGKGGKVSNCTREQTEALSLINEDLKTLFKEAE